VYAGHNVVYIGFSKKRGINIVYIKSGIAEQEPIQKAAKKIYARAGLFSAKYSCESALSAAWSGVEVARSLQPAWP